MVIGGLALNLVRRIMVRSPTTTIGKGLKPLDARTDLPNQIKLEVKGKKKIYLFLAQMETICLTKSMIHDKMR
jgi:hypothetical protein